MLIYLSKGKVSVIDAIDCDLSELNWHAQRAVRKHSECWYAFGSICTERDVYVRVGMHRVILERILNRPLLNDEQVDHINHDGLDNRRSNLRLATMRQNRQNQKKRGGPVSSRFKGVYWQKCRNKWYAQIRLDHHKIHLGCFDNEEDAARAYDDAAKKLFGVFGVLNFTYEEA